MSTYQRFSNKYPFFRVKTNWSASSAPVVPSYRVYTQFQRTCFSMIKGYGRCISLLGPSPLAYWLPPTGSNSALSNRRSFPSTPFLSVSLPRSFYTSRIKRKCQLINGSAKRATWTIKFQSYAWFIGRLFCNTAKKSFCNQH